MVSIIMNKDQEYGNGNKVLEYRGLSTDLKPTTYGGKAIDNGTMFIEIDTGKIYMFDAVSSEWKEI